MTTPVTGTGVGQIWILAGKLCLFGQNAYRALVGARSKGCIGLQCRRDIALARGSRLPAKLFLLGAATCEFFIRDPQIDCTVGDVDVDHVAIVYKTDRTALRRLGRRVTN